jgi:AraC family transcriptional regulator, transcriptional activator of pobA
MKGIPNYPLKGFRQVHRQEQETSNFGYNQLSNIQPIAGFELYSSSGLKPAVGPLKSAFYRISITISGSVDMQIGLQHFKHQPCTISFTYPNQVFSKWNISADAFGYYILFDPEFLIGLVPSVSAEFPFFDFNGHPCFQLTKDEISRVQEFVLKINDELHANNTGRGKAVQMYLYLLLLEAKRSYERQQFQPGSDTEYLVSRFQKLVGRHFLEKRKVTEYASLLSVTANHLNRVVKEATGKTASDAIALMLLQEAKALLKYTDASVAEIAYQLNFSEPGAFNRFFKKGSGHTPLDYRKNA